MLSQTRDMTNPNSHSIEMANFMYEHTDLNVYNQMSGDPKMMYSIRSPVYPRDLTISSDNKPLNNAIRI